MWLPNSPPTHYCCFSVRLFVCLSVHPLIRRFMFLFFTCLASLFTSFFFSYFSASPIMNSYSAHNSVCGGIVAFPVSRSTASSQFSINDQNTTQGGKIILERILLSCLFFHFNFRFLVSVPSKSSSHVLWTEDTLRQNMLCSARTSFNCSGKQESLWSLTGVSEVNIQGNSVRIRLNSYS